MSEYLDESPDEILASLRKREQQFQQWAKAREAANMVTKSAGSPSMASDGWFEAAMSAIGTQLLEERKRYEQRLEAEIAKVRIELLDKLVDQERSVKRLKVVAPPDSMVG